MAGFDKLEQPRLAPRPGSPDVNRRGELKRSLRETVPGQRAESRAPVRKDGPAHPRPGSRGRRDRRRSHAGGRRLTA